MPRIGRSAKGRMESRRNASMGPAYSAGGGGRSGGGGLPANKSLGQNFLTNQAIIDRIVEKACIKGTDTVLEIGPGTGNLTIKLLDVAKRVIVVEKDPRMVVEVQRRCEGHPGYRHLSIIQGDILKVDLPYFDVCVANVPYNISSAITFMLLTHDPPYRNAVLMFQKEFAERLVARPATSLWSRLSVNTQLLARVAHELKVGRNNFRPPPKVDSAVVSIVPRIPRPPVNFVSFDGLTRLLFNRKNKTIRAGLTNKATLQIIAENARTHHALASDLGPLPLAATDPKAAVLQVLEKDTDFGEKRAAKLSIDDILVLLDAFARAGIHFA